MTGQHIILHSFSFEWVHTHTKTKMKRGNKCKHHNCQFYTEPWLKVLSQFSTMLGGNR